MAAGQKKLFSNTVTSMDRHLGAYAADFSGLTGYWQTGLFYQWGRKDPFIGPASWTGTTKRLLYDASGNVYTQPANVTTAVPPINNPGSFSTGNSGSDGNNSWFKTGLTKTIYDPCPAGWKVPANGAYAALSIGTFPWVPTTPTHRSSAVAGIYPASGYIWEGAVNAAGVDGDCWSSTPVSSNAYHIGYRFEFVTPSQTNPRSFGFPVRCVKE